MIFCNSFILLNNALAKSSWPSVRGIIISSNIAGERAIHPDIVYEYEIQGVLYSGVSSLNTPPFGNKRKRYDIASKEIINFSVGDTINVLINPKDPSESYIKHQFTVDIYVKLALGATLLMLSGFFSPSVMRWKSIR
ncbi:MAG: DUF3592 domain-containing protein [Candidatus Zixiibacteriota bacterium]